MGWISKRSRKDTGAIAAPVAGFCAPASAVVAFCEALAVAVAAIDPVPLDHLSYPKGGQHRVPMVSRDDNTSRESHAYLA
ncbi:hypothetical protein GCM10009099_31040 [Caenispirillum bisanense]